MPKVKPKKALSPEFTLSNSERQLFIVCRRKYFWSYIKRYAPLATPTPFLVGSAFHEILKQFYLGNKNINIDEIVNGIFGPAISGEDGRRLAPEQLEDLHKQETMTVGMCDAYLRVYANDLKKWKVIEIDGKPAVELKASFPVTPQWQMFFTADMLIEAGKKIWIVEHKTTASIDTGYVSRLSLDEQISTYLVGCQKKWGMVPAGVIYNVAMKPRIRQKQDEEYSEYLGRVMSLYTENAQEYLYRCNVLRSNDDLKIFERELELFTEELMRTQQNNFYYKNTNACTVRGTCPFMPLCVEGEDNAKDRFRIKDPRDRYEEEEA